jgi:hypothetical protein
VGKKMVDNIGVSWNVVEWVGNIGGYFFDGNNYGICKNIVCLVLFLWINGT